VEKLKLSDGKAPSLSHNGKSMDAKAIVKQEKEFLPAKRFVEFYGSNNGVHSVQLLRLETNSKTKTPDYYLPELNAYLEVKELHDRDDVERFAQWGAIVSKFKEYIEKKLLKKRSPVSIF
jgi:hypothetical protein